MKDKLVEVIRQTNDNDMQGDPINEELLEKIAQAILSRLEIDPKAIEHIIWGSDLVNHKGGASFVDVTNLAEALSKADILRITTERDK